MTFVHQDLGLILELTVLENLRVGELIAPGDLDLLAARSAQRARETFARYGIALDPTRDRRRADARSSGRCWRSCARSRRCARSPATAARRGLLVLDEPTVFLPREGIDQLFALVREIAPAAAPASSSSPTTSTRCARSPTASRCCATARVAGTVVTAETSEAQLVEMIIGRRLRARSTSEHHDLTEQRGRRRGRGPRPAATLATSRSSSTRGEVVGITGLVGSGFEEVPYLLFGAGAAARAAACHRRADARSDAMTPDRGDRGRDGADPRRPAARRQRRLAPGRRQRDARRCSTATSTASALDRAARCAAEAGELMREFDVRPSDRALPYAALSRRQPAEGAAREVAADRAAAPAARRADAGRRRRRARSRSSR